MYWLPYSLGATLSLGIAMSLYKLPSFKGYSSFFSTFWTNIFSSLFVMLTLLIVDTQDLSNFSKISFFAIGWGVFFAITMVLQKILLQKVESISAYPVTSSLGSIVTVLLGLTLFSEHVSTIQALGIITIIISTFLYTKKDGSFPLDARTISLSLGIIASSTISKYLQKLGAVHDNHAQFMMWQYIGAAVFALIIARIFEKNNFKNITQLKKYWKGSFLIAFFSTLGGYLILKALALGPLSGVYAIHPSYTFIAGIMGFLLFKEKLTKRKIFLAILSIIGIILIKIG